MSPLMGIYAAATRRTLDGKHPEGWVPGAKDFCRRGGACIHDGLCLRQFR